MTDKFEMKQALIVRTDLGMGRGKIAVQCSHAAVSSAFEARDNFREWYDNWTSGGQTKIALRATDVGLLLDLERRAKNVPVPVFLVRDMGLTQVPAGTVTCLGVGPAPIDTIDSLTGKLRLL